MDRWAAELRAWKAWLAAAGRPNTTMQLRHYQLMRWAEACPDPWAGSTERMVEWLTGQSWSLETMRSHRSALTTFYRWAHDTGRISENPAASLPPIRPADPKPRPTPDVVLTDALGKADARVRLMLLLAARQGLRRAEIATVHSDNLARDLDGWSLLVHGKGRRDRIVPLCDEVARGLLCLDPGWAFPGLIDGHLSPAYVGKLMSRVLPGDWTAHTLRHRFATRTWRGSRDLFVVQTLLGHTRPETTRRYVEVASSDLRSALAFAG